MHRLIKPVVSLTAFAGLNKVLGFFEKIVMAKYLGTSVEADILFVFLSLLIAIWVISDTILRPAIIPVYNKYDGQNEKAAIFYKSIWVSLVSALCVASSIFVFRQEIINLLLPGYAGYESMGWLFGYVSVSAFAYVAFPAFQAYLNATNEFVKPIIAQIAGRVCMLFCIVAGYKTYQIHAIGVGLVLYTFISLLVLYLLSRNTLKAGKTADIKYSVEILKLSLPLLLGVAFSQAAEWFQVRYLSLMDPGALSAVNYAKKLIDAPVYLLAYGMGIVLLPNIKNTPADRGAFLFMIGFVCVVYSLLMIVYLLFGSHIISFVYGHGMFNGQSTAITSEMLRLYAPGLLVFSVEIILMQFLLALRCHWYLIGIGIVCAIFNMVLTSNLIDRYHAGAIPIADVAQKGLKVIILSMMAVVIFRKESAFTPIKLKNAS